MIPALQPVTRARPRLAPQRPAFRALQLADLAVDVLTAEAMLTPKPALVDQRGPGAHRDLNLGLLLASARSLHGAFLEMATVSAGHEPDQALRERLAAIGRAGECDMLAASGGSNTHRGAIWTIGLLVAARAIAGSGAGSDAGASAGSGAEPRTIVELAGRIAQFEDRFAPRQPSHGSRVCEVFGVHGARGEAAAGFPHVVDIGLPALRAARARGATETCAQLDALMAIMRTLDDTCLLHRAGRPALRAAQCGARAVLSAGGTSTAPGWRALLLLDAQLLALRASPGGSADLLAACLFLDQPR